MDRAADGTEDGRSLMSGICKWVYWFESSRDMGRCNEVYVACTVNTVKLLTNQHLPPFHPVCPLPQTARTYPVYYTYSKAPHKPTLTAGLPVCPLNHTTCTYPVHSTYSKSPHKSTLTAGPSCLSATPHYMHVPRPLYIQ